MGKTLVKILSSYIDTIKTEKIKNFVIEILDMCLDIHAERPASSSGKYHPICDLGPGGLVRHSILTAKIADIMCNAFNDGSPKMQLERDIIFASALIHDFHKYETGIEYTLKDHAIRMADVIRSMNVNNDPDITKIADNVESHMSRFGDDAPRPKTIGQYIVSFADLISANKELPIMMNEFTEQAEAELNNKTE